MKYEKPEITQHLRMPFVRFSRPVLRKSVAAKMMATNSLAIQLL